MGMSASQARLLSITSRLTNNEFRAQTITNSKLRLAEKSQEVSSEYMDALNSQQLVYGVYDDATGEKKYTPLTANTILSYGDLKNQYSIVNSSGKILLNSTDIKKYVNAANMADFLYSYGISKVDNPKYADKLMEIFGKNYEKFYDPSNPNKYTQDKNGNCLDYRKILTNNIYNIDPANISETDYNNIKSSYQSELNAAGIVLSAENKGVFENFVKILNNMPEYVPAAAYPAEEPNLLDYASELLSPQCWDDTGIANLRNEDFSHIQDGHVWHMEHVLAQYMWTSQTETINVNIDGTAEKINNTNVHNRWGLCDGGGNGDDPMRVRDVLNRSQNSQLKKEMQELYYQIALYIDKNHVVTGLVSGNITNDGRHDCMSKENIGKKYLELINKLLVAVAEDILTAGPSDSRYNSLSSYSTAKEAYDTQVQAYNDYESFKKEFPVWTENTILAIKEFEKYISSIPVAKIPDENDAKYQWYVNLWYRMGSQDEQTKGDGSAYKELEENLINNPEWLQFCFEHGLLTLEHAQFNENGSVTYPKMGTYDWVSIMYNNANDFLSQENETAIAIAEVKYKNEITKINNKDKKYDQDLKKLDTEHTALQTEYESLKEVISKNTERSFKAFS